MVKNKYASKILFIALIILSMGIGFFINNNIIINSKFLFVIAGILIIIIAILKKYLVLGKQNVWWIVFIMYSMPLVIASSNSNSYEHLILLILGVLIITVYSKENIVRVFGKIMCIISTFYTVITIYSALFKESYIFFISRFYSGEVLEMTLSLFNSNAYAGIAGQVGSNAFIISVGIIVLLSNIFNNMIKQTKFDYLICILLLLHVLSLILTCKRGIIVFLIITIIILAYIVFRYKIRKGSLKPVVFAMLSILVISIIFIFFEPINNIIEKNNLLLEDENLLNGRMYYYQAAIEMFKTKPVVGWGLNTYPSIMNKDTNAHNVYLQLLAETGIIGLIVFLITIFTNIFKNVKTLIVVGNKSENIPFLIQCLGIQLLFALYCMTGNPFYDINMIYIYMVFVALFINVYNEEMVKTS